MYTCHKILKIKVRESLEKEGRSGWSTLVCRKSSQGEETAPGHNRMAVILQGGTLPLLFLCIATTRENLSSGHMPKTELSGKAE